MDFSNKFCISKVLPTEGEKNSYYFITFQGESAPNLAQIVKVLNPSGYSTLRKEFMMYEELQGNSKALSALVTLSPIQTCELNLLRSHHYIIYGKYDENLSSYINRYTTVMRFHNQRSAKVIFKMLVQNLQCLHSSNLVHLNIRLDNIWFNSLNQRFTYSDLSLAKFVGEHGGFTKDFDRPSDEYVAPELAKAKNIAGAILDGFKIDIYALGVVLYYLVFGVNDKLTTLSALNETISSHQLIRSLLSEKPNDRPSLKKILNSEWLRDI
jgi:serine/threonine protein kinase